jgi:hypothetical protein
VVVDSEGRAIDNTSWIKSKMFPLRTDVSNKQIEEALVWLDKKNMIRRYQVSGRNYFHVVTFKDYQTGTEREAKSVLPAPDELKSNSRVTPEQLASCSTATVYESVNESESVSVNVLTPHDEIKDPELPDNLDTPDFIDTWHEWVKYRAETKHKLTKTTVIKQINKLAEHPPDTAVAMLNQSIENGWQGIFPLNNNGKKQPQHDYSGWKCGAEGIEDL